MTIGNNLYGKFSYSLLILSLPTYYILKIIDSLYGAHVFYSAIMGAIARFVVFLMAKIRNMKHQLAWGIISFIIRYQPTGYFFKPIYFPKWGNCYPLNLLILYLLSFSILIIYMFFKNFFSDKIALFASLLFCLRTAIAFYAISLKHHILTLFLHY